MLLVFQSRSNSEFSEIRDVLKAKFGLVNRKKNRAICKDILNKITQLKLNEITASIAFSIHY